MKLVLRAALARHELRPAGEPEVTRRRGIAFSPSGGSRVILTRRTPAQAPQQAPAAAAPVPA